MGELYEAMVSLTEEIVASKARSQYPYVLVVGPCARFESGQAENAEIAIYAKLTSEIYGDIASASDRTVEGALVQLSRDLQRSRAARQMKESRVQAHGSRQKIRRPTRNRVRVSS